MEKYQFKVRKVITNKVEVKAEGYHEALVKLFDILLFKDKELFEKSEEKNVDFDIFLEKINGKDDIKSIQNMKEILKNLESKEDNFSNNIGKKNNNFSKIICEKCGDCICLDKDFMS